MEENWKRGLCISWYLLGPLLLYALVNDVMLLCWERVREASVSCLSNVPGTVAAAATGAAVLWSWYRRERGMDSKLQERKSRDMNLQFRDGMVRSGCPYWMRNFGRRISLIVTAAASCIFFNHLLILLGISREGYDQVKGLVFDMDLIWQIAGSGLLVPLAEELVFRGLGYGRLRREMDHLPAAVITALLFGLYHGNLIQGIYAFLMGLLLALVCEAYDNLAASWLFHAAANLTAILFTGTPVERWLFADRLVMAAVTVIGGMILFGFIVKIREDIK